MNRPPHPLSFMSYVFLYVNTVFGLAFALPYDLGQGTSQLFMIAFNVGSIVPIIWGWILLGCVVLCLLGVAFRNMTMTQTSGATGFCLWIFGLFGYLFANFTFGMLVGAVPLIAFWGGVYIYASKYKRIHGR